MSSKDLKSDNNQEFNELNLILSIEIVGVSNQRYPTIFRSAHSRYGLRIEFSKCEWCEGLVSIYVGTNLMIT